MNKEQSQQKQEQKGLPRRIKTALFVLAGVFLICLLTALARSMMSTPGKTDDVAILEATLDKKLRSLPDDGLTLKFNRTKMIPGGAGLNDWFQSVENGSKVKSAQIDYTAFYAIDRAGDWEITLKDGRLHVLVPSPDLKAVNVEPSTLKIEIADGALTSQEKDVISQILRENLASVVREEEERTRAQRLDEIRGQVRTFVSSVFPAEAISNIEIVFPGEGSTPEENP